MDFENVGGVEHEAHHHQRLFLEAWISVKAPNAGVMGMITWSSQKSLQVPSTRHAHKARATFQFK